MNAERLTAEDWVNTYVGQDQLEINAFRDWFSRRYPVHRSMKGLTDAQDWVDEYSRIQWETSPTRRKFQPVYTVDAEELAVLLREQA